MIVDYRDGVSKGLNYFIEQIQLKESLLVNNSDDYNEKSQYYQAARIVLNSAITFANRFSDEALRLQALEKDAKRYKELGLIAKVCKKVPAQPAESFHEALQSFWFIHLIL